MPRALLLNCHIAHKVAGVHNRGSAAVMICTIEMLRKAVPGLELATFIQLPADFAERYGVRVVRNKLFTSKPFSLRTVLRSGANLVRAGLWSAVPARVPLVSRALIGGKDLREYATADLIVDVSMDLFSDDFGTVAVAEHSKDILIGALLGKPVVVWAQSVGPFRSRWTSWLARRALNRTSLITVREEISLRHLRELGVRRPPIHVTADPAFLLEPAARERGEAILSGEGIDAGARPLVGMTMSWTTLMAEAKNSRYLRAVKSAFQFARLVVPEPLLKIAEKRARRVKRLDKSSFLKVETMSGIADSLAEKLGAVVVLIPHDTAPMLDDRVVARSIADKVRDPARVRVIEGMYTAPELKAVIGLCDLFIGGKMHANIAALTMHVPTVAVQYGHKFHGIMGLLGQDEYVCDRLAVDEVMVRAERAWANRAAVSADLAARTAALKQRSLENAALAAGLLACLSLGGRRTTEREYGCGSPATAKQNGVPAADGQKDQESEVVSHPPE